MSVVRISIAIVVCRHLRTHTDILLVKPNNGVFSAQWCLPGCEYGEHSVHTCERNASEALWLDTDLRVIERDFQLRLVASEPNRDPRGPSICLVYRVDFREHRAILNLPPRNQWGAELAWVPAPDIILGKTALAMDHRFLIRRAITGFSRA